MEWVPFSILYHLVVALLQTSQLFIPNAEPKYFIHFCSHWLLPALLLHEDHTNLDWVAKVRVLPYIFYGHNWTFWKLQSQFMEMLIGIFNEIYKMNKLLVAYFFVWAIKMVSDLSFSDLYFTVCLQFADGCPTCGCFGQRKFCANIFDMYGIAL